MQKDYLKNIQVFDKNADLHDDYNSAWFDFRMF